MGVKSKVLEDLITAMEDREASQFGAKPLITIAIADEGDEEPMAEGGMAGCQCKDGESCSMCEGKDKEFEALLAKRG